jgi:2-C-methyl-D-erythritol 2,4-cyclodiphosphate synthase
MKIRVGMGYDVHQLVEGKDLWLGGIKLKHTKGLDGHSDADALIHAICDALLGAAGMRDIGFHFPNTDDRFKGIDSKLLLAETVKLIGERGFVVGNVDSTLVIEQPKINPHIDEMKQAMAPILGVTVDDISIKATTNETMGFVGREEGVAAYAVALINYAE